MHHNFTAHGTIKSALGNLVQVKFDGNVAQGETGFIVIGEDMLKAEIIEIEGKIAKMQVFEDIRGLKYGDKVGFLGELLKAELGPGLLAQVFDGLQNPLEDIAEVSGLYLQRGVYIEALNRVKKWDYTPIAKKGDQLRRGDVIGTVPEAHFTHKIMLPFSMYGKYTVTWVIEPGHYTVDTVIAKVKDKEGEEHELTMVQEWPIKFPLFEGNRESATDVISTGIRVIDTINPVAKGGTVASPGPFGAGKTVIQHLVAKYSNVEIVVIAACGERAGEVVETLKTFPKLTDVYSGQPLMNRTSIICNTSSMPVAAREASVYMGMTLAEYYRQMGYNVLLLADSTSRWAQAMREMSARLEEIPGEEAFPAYLASRIAAFYERAGVVRNQRGEVGTVTVLASVSPAGGNPQNDPVSQATLKVVGGYLNLSRELSDARKYPAIDPLLSWSKYVKLAGQKMRDEYPDWENWVYKSIEVLREGDEIARRMEVVGYEGTPMEDFVLHLKAELLSFVYLQQNAFDKEDVYCSMDRQKKQFSLVQAIIAMPFSFYSHDDAKAFFLDLQNEVRALNYESFNSDRYQKMYQAILDRLEHARATAGV